jgi:hypothetical protein
MQACEPARKERTLPQTPGIPLTAAGTRFSVKRVGLHKEFSQGQSLQEADVHLLPFMAIRTPELRRLVNQLEGYEDIVALLDPVLHQVYSHRHQTQQTYVMLSLTIPFRSTNGLSKGRTSSFTAPRMDIDTGECNLSVSRTTASSRGRRSR